MPPFRGLVTVYLSSLIALAGATEQAQAQEIRLVGHGLYARITGEISPFGGDRLGNFLDQNPQVVALQLASPGGSVVGSIEMAAEINARQLGTFVPPGDDCASACALLFFAGHDRLLEGRLGLHQMDDGGRSNASALQFMLADQLDAFLQYDTPWPLLQRMLTTPPTEMYWLTVEDTLDFAVNRDLPSDAPAAGLAAGLLPLSDRSNGMASFSDFAVDTVFTGSSRQPDFDGEQAGYRNFRTRISNGAAAGPNFAGHFAIIVIGCGTSCRFAFVVDVESGTVQDFPYGGEEHYGMSLIYVVESRLVRVKWLSDWEDMTCIEQDMVFEEGDWQVIAERSTPANGDQCM